MSPRRGRSRQARSSAGEADRAGAHPVAISRWWERSSTAQFEDQCAHFEKDIQRHEHEQGRQWVDARGQEVGDQGEAHKPPDAVLVEPSRADNAQKSQHHEHDRQLEHDPEADDHEQDEADELCNVREVRDVGWCKGVENANVQRQRIQRRGHAQAEEEDGGDDQRQRQLPLVPVQTRAHEPPDLLDHDRRRNDEADIDGDLEASEDKAARAQIDRMHEPSLAEVTHGSAVGAPELGQGTRPENDEHHDHDRDDPERVYGHQPDYSPPSVKGRSALSQVTAIVIELILSVEVIAWSLSFPATTVPNRLYVAVGPAPGQAPLTMKNWLPLIGPPGIRAIPTEPGFHLRKDAGSSGRL